MAGAGDGVPVLLVTANVGSIFEEPSTMLKIWTEEFLSTVLRLDPKFIALHCQEVGGKNYEQSMKHVEEFVRLLMSSEELRLFDKVRVFLDEDFSSAEHFTALGNLYFVHDSVKEVLIWDFKDCTFVPADGKEVHSGSIETVTTKEKAKFPQDFFPECKWSRKGFLRTRWNISGTVFDLINIHLFHDASNFIAMETFPSVYSKTRRRALEHTLDRFHNDKYSNVPYFLFGDFNFRTDTAGVIKKLTEDTQEKIFSNKGSISKLQFRNKDDDLILTLGKKEFTHCNHENVFLENGGEWLREYDRELEDFQGRLYEFPIKFMPSYPFEEDVNEATNYMHTRVPAWCDRILLSPTARMLVQDTDSLNAVDYGIIGPTTCMGDHKPVYLRAMIIMNAGTIECCRLPTAPMYCFRVPASYMGSLSILPDCSSYASARGFYSSERSSNLLHAIPIKHDPYTPDSMDSPSPNTLTASGEAPDVLCSRREIYAAVPPALLKSKLELIVQSKRQEEQDLAKREHQVVAVNEPPSRRASQRFSGRRKRSNSDVSSHSSSLAQSTWLSVDKSTHRGYRSFADFQTHQSRLDLPLDQVIPKIAIINASNFESNESSVYAHDDRLDSECKLNSSSRVDDQTIPGRDYSNVSDADRTSTQYRSKDFLTKKNNNDHLNTEMDNNVRLQEENIRTEQDEKDTVGSRRYSDEDAVHDQRLDVANKEVEDNKNVTKGTTLFRNPRNDEEIVDFQESLRKTTKLLVERSTKPVISSVLRLPEQVGVEETNSSNTHEKPCIMVEERCGGQKIRVSNVIRSDRLTRKPSCNDIEVFGTESRQEMITSKNSTRSNSIESQDIGDSGGSVKLKLKAYKVTERYTNNIVGKQGKCHGCCCAVS